MPVYLERNQVGPDETAIRKSQIWEQTGFAIWAVNWTFAEEKRAEKMDSKILRLTSLRGPNSIRPHFREITQCLL